MAALVVACIALAVTWTVFGALVPLGPCGLGVLRYNDLKWTVVNAENFDEQTAPKHWQGRGLVTSKTADRLTYLDFSGTKLTFAPGSTNPTGCS